MAHQTFLGDRLAKLSPYCLLSFSLCQSPYGLGFILSACRHKFLFGPIALSSPSWKLLSFGPFSGHAFSLTALEYGLSAVSSSSLPSHRVIKWLSCRLSPAQTSSTHIRLTTLTHSDFTSWPFAKNMTFFHKIDNFLAHMSALGPYNLLPFRHITTSLPQKDCCLNRLCLLRVSYLISLLSLGLSPEPVFLHSTWPFNNHILPLSDTILLNFIFSVLSDNLIALPVLLSNYFTLLVNNLFISTLLIIANMLYCSSCLLNTDFRLRLTLLTHSALTQNVIPFKTTYSHSNNHYHHQRCIAHTLQDYCLSR